MFSFIFEIDLRQLPVNILHCYHRTFISKVCHVCCGSRPLRVSLHMPHYSLFFWKKVYIASQTIHGGVLHPQTIKPDFLPPELSKTGQITLQAVLDGGFATVTVVLSFSFLFISAESLKNHNKSQKNHKIKNLILSDST